MCSRTVPAHIRDYTEIGCRFLELPERQPPINVRSVPSGREVQGSCDF
jgi:hypothetical protein